MTTFYLREPIGDDGVIHAVARMEGPGVLGDAPVTIRPGDTVAGLPYADLVAALSARGWIALPGSDEQAQGGASAAGPDVRYYRAFGRSAPFPTSLSDTYRAEVIEAALIAGQPIPADFGWWDYPPPGTVS